MSPFFFVTAVDIAFIPVVIGLVAVYKMTGLASRWAAVSAIVSGILLVGLETWASAPASVSEAVLKVVVGGVVIGLAASGLYSGTSATISSQQNVD